MVTPTLTGQGRMINREETIELGTRRELFVGDYLIDTWT